MPNLLFAKSTYTPGMTPQSERTALAVTPADGTDLPGGPTAGLAITGAGNVNVQLSGGGTAVLTSLVAGQQLPIGVTRVLATNTTATGIFALYPAGNL